MSKSKETHHHHYYGKVYPAVFLILIGTAFLLSNFDILPKDWVGKLWPLFIIVPGVFMLFASRK